jgi:hypothetical protein
MAIKGYKISPILKDYSQTSGSGKDAFHSLESSLAKHGFSRAPGTFRTFTPYKEMTGLYRTGLDENASYLKRLSGEERAAEVKRIIADRARLEQATGLDLSPKSSYYNFNSSDPEDRRFTPVKLGTTDKFFDISDPIIEITWNWIKVHPSIAPSFDAYKRGDVDPIMTQFFVCDDEIETKRTYEVKSRINKAIAAFEGLDFEKKTKIARLMGLPVTDSTKPENVYNLMDNLLKKGEFDSGEFKGNSTINMFNELLIMNDSRLHIKDVVDEAIRRNVYRERGDKVYEGESKIADSKQALVDYLLDDDHQDDLIALEKKVKIKKITATL